MELSLLFSMAGFALVMSLTPGPVNMVAFGAGARYGFRASLRHVWGATVGFVLLLLLMGAGLNEVLQRWPALALMLHWSGLLFLGYMAWLLVADRGELSLRESAAPALYHGALMQWLNPKAWLAASMGAASYGAGVGALLLFSLIYLVICLLSIACWAYAGSRLQHHLWAPHQQRWFNRVMAALLLGMIIELAW